MGAELSLALHEALPVELRARIAFDAELDRELAAKLAEATAAWPSVQLEPGAFVRALAERVARRPGEPPLEVIRGLPAGDLWLVTACLAGDPVAVIELRDEMTPVLRRALAKIGVGDAATEEVLQRVLVMVLIGEGGPPQLAGYQGRGRLRSWLRAITVRTGRRLLGRDAEVLEPSDDDLPALVRDPALDLMRARYRDAVRASCQRAFAALSDRQKILLKQHYFDQLTIDQLARLYRVNRATTARWLATARTALLDAARADLAKHLGLPASDVDSILRLLQSELELSVSALLAR